jgi:hypothetical protein
MPTDLQSSRCQNAGGFAPQGCPCALVVLIDQLVKRAVEAERARAATEEAQLWSRAFGLNTPSDHDAQVGRIVEIASARALLATMNADSSQQQEARP